MVIGGEAPKGTIFTLYGVWDFSQIKRTTVSLSPLLSEDKNTNSNNRISVSLPSHRSSFFFRGLVLFPVLSAYTRESWSATSLSIVQVWFMAARSVEWPKSMNWLTRGVLWLDHVTALGVSLVSCGRGHRISGLSGSWRREWAQASWPDTSAHKRPI